MRAQLRRRTKLIGEKWLRTGYEEDNWNSGTDGDERRKQTETQRVYQGEVSIPHYPERNNSREIRGGKTF